MTSYLPFDGRLVENARRAVHVGWEIVAAKIGVEDVQFPAFEVGGRFAMGNTDAILAHHCLHRQGDAGPHPGVVFADSGVPKQDALAVEGEAEVFERAVGGQPVAGEGEEMPAGLLGLELEFDFLNLIRNKGFDVRLSGRVNHAEHIVAVAAVEAAQGVDFRGESGVEVQHVDVREDRAHGGTLRDSKGVGVLPDEAATADFEAEGFRVAQAAAITGADIVWADAKSLQRLQTIYVGETGQRAINGIMVGRQAVLPDDPGPLVLEDLVVEVVEKGFDVKSEGKAVGVVADPIEGLGGEVNVAFA